MRADLLFVGSVSSRLLRALKTNSEQHERYMMDDDGRKGTQQAGVDPERGDHWGRVPKISESNT